MTQKEIEMQYIGAISLLARLSNTIKLTKGDKYLMEDAISDFCRAFPDRFYYDGDVDRGFCLMLKGGVSENKDA